jgi:hypothetical protein
MFSFKDAHCHVVHNSKKWNFLIKVSTDIVMVCRDYVMAYYTALRNMLK